MNNPRLKLQIQITRDTKYGDNQCSVMFRANPAFRVSFDNQLIRNRPVNVKDEITKAVERQICNALFGKSIYVLHRAKTVLARAPFADQCLEREIDEALADIHNVMENIETFWR